MQNSADLRMPERHLWPSIPACRCAAPDQRPSPGLVRASSAVLINTTEGTGGTAPELETLKRFSVGRCINVIG